MQFLKRQAAVPKGAEHDAAAFGSKIDGEIVGVGRHWGEGLKVKS